MLSNKHCVIFQEMLRVSAYNACKPMADTLNAAVLEAFPQKGKEDIKIIDVAAGTGLAGMELHKLGYTNLHALDNSQEMLNEAVKKNIYKRFFCVPINDQRITGISPGEYDALICVSGFGNNQIEPTALTEMCRIVSKGKIIC